MYTKQYNPEYDSWSIFSPDGELVGMAGDELTADRFLKHLNR